MLRYKVIKFETIMFEYNLKAKGKKFVSKTRTDHYTKTDLPYRAMLVKLFLYIFDLQRKEETRKQVLIVHGKDAMKRNPVQKFLVDK